MSRYFAKSFLTWTQKNRRTFRNHDCAAYSYLPRKNTRKGANACLKRGYFITVRWRLFIVAKKEYYSKWNLLSNQKLRRGVPFWHFSFGRTCFYYHQTIVIFHGCTDVRKEKAKRLFTTSAFLLNLPRRLVGSENKIRNNLLRTTLSTRPTPTSTSVTCWFGNVSFLKSYLYLLNINITRASVIVLYYILFWRRLTLHLKY